MEYYTNALSWLTTASADFNKFTMVGRDSFTPVLLSAMQMAHLTSSDIYFRMRWLKSQMYLFLFIVSKGSPNK